MKKAAKVFIILDIIFFGFLLIPNLIFCCIALGQMNYKKPIGMGICLIIFGTPFLGTLAGIFLLCSRESEYGSAPMPMPAPAYVPPTSTPYAPPASYAAPSDAAPAKEKSFGGESDAPKGGSSAEDDLAAQMQRMFDSQN